MLVRGGTRPLRTFAFLKEEITPRLVKVELERNQQFINTVRHKIIITEYNCVKNKLINKLQKYNLYR